MQGRGDILDPWRPGVLPAMGLFMELGLCRVVEAVMEQDHPVGVRFSYAEHGERVLGYVGFH